MRSADKNTEGAESPHESIGPLEGLERDSTGEVRDISSGSGSSNSADSGIMSAHIPGSEVARAFSAGSGAGSGVDGLALPNTPQASGDSGRTSFTEDIQASVEREKALEQEKQTP